MKSSSQTLLVIAAALCAAFAVEPAFARQGRGRDDVSAPPSSSVAGASLSIRLREKSHGRWEFRMNLENAPSGLAPEVFISDASGALVRAGVLVPDRHDAGEYKLRLRSQKGGALPAGAASPSDLGGRAYDVRESGATIFEGALPALDAKERAAKRGRGADDPAVHR